MQAVSIADLEDFDLEAMKALIRAQHEQLSSRANEIAHLKLLLDKLQRMLFGARSEKLVRQVAQLELQLEELETSRGEEEVSLPLPLRKPIVQKPRPPRRSLPEHLPREVETHRPETSCGPGCGGALREFGEDVSEVLEYVPESFKVVRHVRPKFSCGRCEKVVEAPAPSRPIPRSYDGSGLLAHVLVAKYCDHTPLNRQSEIYAREGVDLDRSTLTGWVGASAALLHPLVESVRHHVLAATRVHADDTPVPVLAPGHGRTKTGRLWTYVRDGRPCADPVPPVVWFTFSPDRRGEHPQAHLKSFRGVLQVDAYAGFHPLYEEGRIVDAPAGPIPGASSTTSLPRPNRPPQPRPSIASANCMPSKSRCADRRPRSGSHPDKPAPGRSWKTFGAGSQMLQTLSIKSDMAGAIRYALWRWTALTRRSR
jgi:transposase